MAFRAFSSPPWLMRNALAVLLVLLSAFLLFWRLDSIPLWRDETTTANWGRLMAESDVWIPYVYDGKQLIVQAADGHDVNSHMLPAMQSWLQFYVSGIGFKLFGVSTWSARAPFALLGGLTIFVLYRLGVVLFGGGLRPFLLPYIGLLSINFLYAARNSRYYVIILLAASLLLLEMCRYFRDPDLAASKGLYIRLGLYGALLYFSNYLGFAGMWLALGVFALIEGDRRFLRNFIGLSAIMGVVLGIEFWALHSEFAGMFPPPLERPLIDTYKSALAGRGRDFWRGIPLVPLVPVGFFLVTRRVSSAPLGLTAALACGSLVAVSPFFYSAGDLGRLSRPAFWAFAALCLTVPGGFLWAWKKLPTRGPWSRAALLAGLILFLSPLVGIAAGKDKSNSRHYYQTLPAAALLCALAAAQTERTAGKSAAAALLAGVLIWPNLDWGRSGGEHIVERQFTRNDSYSQPLIDYLQANVQPDDKVAFLRNVKGMTVYFYMPEMNWVALLDSDAPHNQQFHGRIPDDQFDDYRGVAWYVLWDPRGVHPRGLDDRFEKVWEYSYDDIPVSWWDRGRTPSTRTYEVFRKKPGA